MGKIGLIIEREFKQRVAKRSFLIVTLLMPLAMVALVLVPAMLAKTETSKDQTREIVVVDESGLVASKLQNGGGITFVADTTGAPNPLERHSDCYGVLQIGSDIVANPASLKLYTTQAVTMGVESELKSQISQIITQERIAATGIENLGAIIAAVEAHASIQTFEVVGDRKSSEGAVEKSSTLSMTLAYGSGLMIYMFIFIYGMMVLQGVVEEKSSRIIEVIVSSVRPFELMMGKIIGIAFVALLQFTIWIVVAVAILALLPSLDPSLATSMAASSGSGIDPVAAKGAMGSLSMLFDPWFVARVVGGFLIFFAGGYLLYAAMFAAVGSAVDNAADTQQLQLPITIPLIVALMVMVTVMKEPHSDIAFWFSIVPFTSPIIMMARIPYGVPLWELLLSVGLLYGTFLAMTSLAAKIYRTGIFMYGKKPTLLEIIRWARYKN